MPSLYLILSWEDTKGQYWATLPTCLASLPLDPQAVAIPTACPQPSHLSAAPTYAHARPHFFLSGFSISVRNF